MGPLVSIDRLAVAFPRGGGGLQRVVDGVSLDVDGREAVGVVGESGCGKTLTALAMLRLVPVPGRIVAGAVAVDGTDVVAAGDRELGHLRGGVLGMMFQEPSQALNPVRSIGFQVGEAARLHRGLDAKAAREEARRLLDEVGLEGTARLLAAYPHQLSGGQRQRALLASALSGNPRVLVADEPTSALDPATQVVLLDLLDRLRRSRGLAFVLISHDLPLVARVVERVSVLYAGETVETSPTRALFDTPLHPYTEALLRAIPTVDPAQVGPLPTIPGTVPRPGELGAGCRFAPRCARAFGHCLRARPALVPVGDGRAVRCFLHSTAEEEHG